ncbi:MAG: hypothetical protein GXP62_06620 [Oligoflexia bacterium]|nr:hypothetical protein [Oligoflexia bacterium]
MEQLAVEDLSLFLVNSAGEVRRYLAAFWGWRDPTAFYLESALFVLLTLEEAEATGGTVVDTEAHRQWPADYCRAHRSLRGHQPSVPQLVDRIRAQPDRVEELDLVEVYSEMLRLLSETGSSRTFRKRVRKRVRLLKGDDPELHARLQAAVKDFEAVVNPK